MEEVLKAISDGTRRDILVLIWRQEMPAGIIASNFAMSRPAVSQHLKVLKDAGLVEERRVGVQRLYKARPEGLHEVRSFLEGFWNDRLLDLKLAVEKDKGGNDGGN